MKYFNLIIIGDEILHGNRQDKHFAFFKNLLEQHGFKLNSVQYLPDERSQLVCQLQRSFSDGIPAFVTGGIGATPDDHTRQAAAEALNLPLELHTEAAAEIERITLKRGETLDSEEHRQRLNLATFPQGAALVHNPYNNIAGFSLHEHYFLPGFPVMAHPMAQWILDTYYADEFCQTPQETRSVYLFNIPESRIAALMEQTETAYPGIKTYSLPSVGRQTESGNTIAPHIEFGLKTEGDAVSKIDEAWAEVCTKLIQLGADLQTELNENEH